LSRTDDLVPAPRQRRAEDTVARLVAATSGLLDDDDESAVTLAAIEEASGISSGSLAHHFGGRGGAILAAHGRRFQRLMERQRDLIVPLFGAADTEEALAHFDVLLDGLRSGGEPRDRLTALSVLAAARHRPELRRFVAGELSATTARIAEQLVAAQGAGIVDGRLPPAATAVVLQAVIVLSRTAVDAAPRLETEDWLTLLRTLVHAMLIHDCPATCGLHTARTPTARAAPAPVPDAPPEEDLALIETVIGLLRRDGADAVVARQACADAGVPLSTFHRRFGDRRHLIDAARVEVCRRQALREMAGFAALLDEVEVEGQGQGQVEGADATRFAARLAAQLCELGAMRDPEPHLDRIDLIASAMFRPELVDEVARVTGSAVDRIAETVASAQARGLMRSDLAPDPVARLLWGLLSTGVVASAAGVTASEWEELIGVTVAVLVGATGPRAATAEVARG